MDTKVTLRYSEYIGNKAAAS